MPKMLWTTHRRRMGFKALQDSFRDGGTFIDIDDNKYTIKDFSVGDRVCLSHEATGVIAWYTVKPEDLTP